MTRRRVPAAVAAACAIALAATGCSRGGADGTGAAGAGQAVSEPSVTKTRPPAPQALTSTNPTTTGPSTTVPSTPEPAAPAPSPTPSSPLGDLTGTLVALDPGHGDVLASVPNPQVPVGRGNGTKPCRVSGTATASGYAEKNFTLDVARRARAELEAAGARVVMTRTSNAVNPCADERGRFANEHDVDAWVSIHADGSTNTALKGYFAIVSDPPLNEAQGAPSRRLADALLDALDEAGFPPNPAYPGALSKRADISGLNVARRPAVMMELGEMKNPGEAATMQTAAGRQRYADAVASGIAAYLRAGR